MCKVVYKETFFRLPVYESRKEMGNKKYTHRNNLIFDMKLHGFSIREEKKSIENLLFSRRRTKSQ